MGRTQITASFGRGKPAPQVSGHGSLHGRVLRDQAMVFFTAIALRGIYFFQLRETPFFHAHVSDTKIYLAIADSILHGLTPAKAWFMSPLYPYLLAGAAWAGLSPDTWVRVAQCFLGAAGATVLCSMGRDALSRRAGLAAGLLAAVYPMFLYMDNALLIESPMTAIVVFHLAVLMRAFRKEDLKLFGSMRSFSACSYFVASNSAGGASPSRLCSVRRLL